MTVFKGKVLEINTLLEIPNQDIQKVFDNSQIWFIGLSIKELKNLVADINIMSLEISNKEFKPKSGLKFIIQALVFMLVSELNNRKVGREI